MAMVLFSTALVLSVVLPMRGRTYPDSVEAPIAQTCGKSVPRRDGSDMLSQAH